MRLNIKSALFALRHDTILVERPPAGVRLLIVTNQHIAGLNLDKGFIDDPSMLAQAALHLGQRFLDQRDGSKSEVPLADDVEEVATLNGFSIEDAPSLGGTFVSSEDEGLCSNCPDPCPGCACSEAAE